MMRPFALVSLMVAWHTAAAFSSPSQFRALYGRSQRSGKALNQFASLPAGWIAGTDQESGHTYYYNEQTGESQWEPPQQHGSTSQQGYSSDGRHTQPRNAEGLPAGWIAGTDQESGHAFYYNEQTGESQWEPPGQSAAFAQQDQYGGFAQQGYGAQVIWQVALTSGWGPRFAGKYKLRNGEEEALGRYDVLSHVPSRPYVSRKQCVVHVAPDGTAALESFGKGPTLFREHSGGQWYTLYPGEKVPLADGYEVSVDCGSPEETVFVCREERNMWR